MPSDQPVPPEKQPWWLPNPPRRPARPEGRPGPPWLISSILAAMGWGPLVLLLAGAHSARSTSEVSPIDVELDAVASYPLASYVIVGGAALIGSWGTWKLLRGNSRSDLFPVIFALWAVWPGQYLAAALLHWFTLWQQDVTIYDAWSWIWAMMIAAIMTTIGTVYLLSSRRMKARYPQTAVDVAAVF